MNSSALQKNAPIEDQIPTHVAIIMDGNRRWANEHQLADIDGHRESLKRIEELVEFAGEIGIKYLTFWAWSTKNWKRSPRFIQGIIDLFRENLKSDGIFQRAVEKGAELRHIGVWDGFPTDIQTKVKKYLDQKPAVTKIVVNLAVGYEGRDELIRAIKKIIAAGIGAAEVSFATMNRFLDTAGQPDVDLLIRTGGEQRTSGYLIWQTADAEFYFTNTYMPDFNVAQFQKALQEYRRRERRMGGDSQYY